VVLADHRRARTAKSVALPDAPPEISRPSAATQRHPRPLRQFQGRERVGQTGARRIAVNRRTTRRSRSSRRCCCARCNATPNIASGRTHRSHPFTRCGHAHGLVAQRHDPQATKICTCCGSRNNSRANRPRGAGMLSPVQDKRPHHGQISRTGAPRTNDRPVLRRHSPSIEDVRNSPLRYSSTRPSSRTAQREFASDQRRSRAAQSSVLLYIHHFAETDRIENPVRLASSGTSRNRPL